LVSLGLELREVTEAIPPHVPEARDRLGRIGEGLDAVLDELRTISRGIHPAILSQGGLVPALKALGRRAAIPVELNVRIDGRLPEPIEVGAYYMISEALTNVSKHARASVVRIDGEVREGGLHLAIRDDGTGGADPDTGSGLIGLRDRAEALGGALEIVSPRGGGTTITVELPLSPSLD
jgi:signal transduction histidine kinase